MASANTDDEHRHLVDTVISGFDSEWCWESGEFLAPAPLYRFTPDLLINQVCLPFHSDQGLFLDVLAWSTLVTTGTSERAGRELKELRNAGGVPHPRQASSP